MFLSSKYCLMPLTAVENGLGSISPGRGAGGVISNKNPKSTNRQSGKIDSNQWEKQQIGLGRRSDEQNKSLIHGDKKAAKGIFYVLKEAEPGGAGD